MHTYQLGAMMRRANPVNPIYFSSSITGGGFTNTSFDGYATADNGAFDGTSTPMNPNVFYNQNDDTDTNAYTIEGVIYVYGGPTLVPTQVRLSILNNSGGGAPPTDCFNSIQIGTTRTGAGGFSTRTFFNPGTTPVAQFQAVGSLMSYFWSVTSDLGFPNNPFTEDGLASGTNVANATFTIL